MPRYNKEDAQLADESNNMMMDVNDSDDEEIDEDEAFNSEDELMYGEFFLKSKSRKKKSDGKLKSTNGDGDRDDDSDDGSYSVSGDEQGGNNNDWASAGSDSSDSEHSNGEEDEDEEDDGGQYMLDLLNNLDKQVPSSTTSGDMKKKDGQQGSGGGGKISFNNNISSEAAVHLQESEYQSGALSSMSSSVNNNNDGGNSKLLTLDSLMGGIADTAGFATVQKSMRGLSSGLLPSSSSAGSSNYNNDNKKNKQLETTKAPVSRIISDRASRKVHYESTSKDITKWKDVIHEQRDAETLDFRTNKGGASANRITRDVLVDKFVPTNDFEKEIQLALEKAGMDDESKLVAREKQRLTTDGDQQEEDVDDIDDLGSNKITLAEYKKRHGELAKLRALMFYEEQKRHRINKIKSKKYRKIRKRQKDREQNAQEDAHTASLGGAEADREEKERIERDEMERMKERMTLAHKNTSKWARRVLRRGNKMDVEERRALSLQIAKGDELRRKVMGEEDDCDSDDEEETEEGLLKKARDILMEDDDENIESKGGKKKGLFQLEFMKKGMEAQRIRAKEEARKLLEELEANEMAAMSSSSDDDDESEEDDDDEGEGEQTTKNKKKRMATEAETKKILPEGKLVASSLKFGKGDGFAIKVDGNIDLVDVIGDGIKGTGTDSDNEQEECSAGKGKKKNKNKKKKNQRDDVVPTDDCKNTKSASIEAAAAAAAAQDEEEENPWIVPKSSSTKKSSKTTSRTININEAASMLVDTVQDDKSSKRKRDDDDGSKSNEKKVQEGNVTENTTQSASKDKDVGVAELSQAELVRRAFASPADLEEAEEEFQKEKERMKERDDPTRKKEEEKFVSGWGSWAGAGAPPPKKPRKLPPKLRAPTSKKVDRATTVKRKDDGMSSVIINEKRLKKTAKFQLSEIPYPYRSREEYEKSIAGNIGQEWNTMHGTKEMSRPAVLVRAGKIIQPIGKRSKQKVKRAPAKF